MKKFSSLLIGYIVGSAIAAKFSKESKRKGIVEVLDSVVDTHKNAFDFIKNVFGTQAKKLKEMAEKEKTDNETKTDDKKISRRTRKARKILEKENIASENPKRTEPTENMVIPVKQNSSTTKKQKSERVGKKKKELVSVKKRAKRIPRINKETLNILPPEAELATATAAQKRDYRSAGKSVDKRAYPISKFRKRKHPDTNTKAINTTRKRGTARTTSPIQA